MIYLELFFQFALISLVAFGGGQSALPLIERKSVAEQNWVTPETFGTAVAFGYITPGPVLITATFIGYQTKGFLGALIATIGVFLIPYLLASFASDSMNNMAKSKWLKAFGKGATPAVIGLLGVTVFSLIQGSLMDIWFYIMVFVTVFLVIKTKIHPTLLLLGGAVIGVVTGFF